LPLGSTVPISDSRAIRAAGPRCGIGSPASYIITAATPQK
jgi:hypothetical protein